MSVNGLFDKQSLENMSWEELFEIAKICTVNANRLHDSAKLLYKNKFTEHAFNNLYISCEEYYKAKSFETIAFIKFQNGKLRTDKLNEFIKGFGSHKFKFQEAFIKSEFNIENVTIKSTLGIDDNQIQMSLRKRIAKTFARIKEIDSSTTKNNALYVGYDCQKNTVLIPEKLISVELVEDLMVVCFLIKINHTVFIDSKIPSGELTLIMEWQDLA